MEAVHDEDEFTHSVYRTLWETVKPAMMVVLKQCNRTLWNTYWGTVKPAMMVVLNQ
jgi:hypothetical protein